MSLIEMESSTCVFFGDNNANADRSEGVGENAGNAGRCFLFVFPSSEVIDEHSGPVSVKAYRVCLAINFSGTRYESCRYVAGDNKHRHTSNK